MALLDPYSQFNEAQMRAVLKMFQKYLRLYMLHMRVAALGDKKSLNMLIMGSGGSGGMNTTDMYKLLTDGEFQSQIGFPVQYNPASQLTRALKRNLHTKTWRSSRTIRLSRVFWKLDYKNVVNEVKYKIPSGKGKGGYMYWLEYVGTGKILPNYAFKPLIALAGGVKGAMAAGAKRKKRPRAYNRPGVGAMKAGYMIKGGGAWSLTQRANPYNVGDDWFMQNVREVAPFLLEYWKKKALQMHKEVLRRYKSSLRGAA